MTLRNEILITSDAPSAKWQLPQQTTGCGLMIGWRLASGRGVDDGVPTEVAAVLARAFTALGWVTFFDASEPRQTADDQVIRSAPSGLGGRVRAVVAGWPREVYVVSTRRPELVATAFDASMFSWIMQGQVILISPSSGARRELDWGQMLSIIRREGPASEAMLTALGADAAIFPGVDGDVAGLVAASEPVKERAFASIREAALSGGFDISLVREDEFAHAMAE